MADPARNPGRSTLAIGTGFIAVVGLSIGTDVLMYRLGIFTAGNEATWPARNFSIALAYRCAYGVLGSYLAARLAPRFPMWHALFLGAIGFALSILGAVFSIRAGNMGPDWYPIAIALTALPCAWIGGLLRRPA